MNNFLLQRVDEQNDLERSHAIGRVVHELEALSLAKTWRVSVEEAKSERSLQQNRYLFGVAYALMSEKTGYEKDDLHTYLLGKHFGIRLKRVPKSKYNPRGLIEVPVRTTTTDGKGHRSVLGKNPFSEYVDFVKRFAAENLGLVIPDPDPAYQIYGHEEPARRAA